jgi:hypothetical protein
MSGGAGALSSQEIHALAALEKHLRPLLPPSCDFLFGTGVPPLDPGAHRIGPSKALDLRIAVEHVGVDVAEAARSDVAKAYGNDQAELITMEGENKTFLVVSKAAVKKMVAALSRMTQLEATLLRMVSRQRRWKQYWQQQHAAACETRKKNLHYTRDDEHDGEEQHRAFETRKRSRQSEEDFESCKKQSGDFGLASPIAGGGGRGEVTCVDDDTDELRCFACIDSGGDLILCKSCCQHFHESCGGPRIESVIQMCRDCRKGIGLDSNSDEDAMSMNTTTEDHVSSDEESTDLSGFIVSDNEELEEEESEAASSSSASSSSSSSVPLILTAARRRKGRGTGVASLQRKKYRARKTEKR